MGTARHKDGGDHRLVLQARSAAQTCNKKCATYPVDCLQGLWLRTIKLGVDKQWRQRLQRLQGQHAQGQEEFGKANASGTTRNGVQTEPSTFLHSLKSALSPGN